MKKRSLLLILVLTISLAIPILLTQTQTVYTEPIITPTKTYQIPINLTTVPGVQVNFTVTTSIGVQIEGNAGGWSLSISAISNDLQNNITSITLNSEGSNGTIINSGIMLRLSNAFTSDVNLTKNYSIYAPTFKTETVYLIQNTAGSPAQLSFNLKLTIETTNSTNSSEAIYLDSDTNGGSTLSIVLPNPNKTPMMITLYTYVPLLLVFLLPVTLIVTNHWLKTRRLKKSLKGSNT